jgi:hypothetical protein
MTDRFLLSDVGNDVIGNTKTFVNVSQNQTPAGSFNVSFSTTYSKAKDPDAHQVKQSLFVRDADALKQLGTFLFNVAEDSSIAF